jgi:(1->4)-alpha-D-glucan 1-alpha-D-glucosylmutase
MTKVPRATYRIQFHPGFSFRDAADIADYLADLGVSHLYASPCLQAAPGSTHGYDVVDPGRVNEELGGEEGHRTLCRVLGENGLGQILDLVPNHMAITGPENGWWWDVLENGPSSPYAAYFDVDWHPPEERLGNKILLPVLGDHYGRVIEAGEIRLSHSKGRFSIYYYDHALPVAPGSLVGILDRAAEISGSDQLAFIDDALRHLPLPKVYEFENTRRRHRNWMFIQDLLKRVIEESPKASSAVDKVVLEINGSPDLLDDFLDKQHYRLSFWRAAAWDLDYRRFFDINTLMGVRVEDETVFADTHRLVLEWLRKGVIDGLRIDHPDGLRDPEQYFQRLRKAAPNAWIAAEKILHPGEHLPSTWQVEGTTGYDFLNLAGGLFVDPSGEERMTDFYAKFTGEETDYLTVAREKKSQVLHELLASDLNRLTQLMVQICERHRRYRDYTRYEIRETLRELIACFPVYRSYVRADADEVREEDRQIISEAVSTARSLRPDLDPELFDFLRSLLLLEIRGAIATEWVMRFQQLTGPAAAKGIEDTAFYCFNRMIALNEVGGDPSTFGVSLDAFHRAMAEAAGRHPHGMLSTSTHDTKRSEDVRARLALLSEISGPWTETVIRWSHHNEQYRLDDVPDRNIEYFLYQTLVGAWPITVERVLAFMRKAAREAKVYTCWTKTDSGYERMLLHFVEAILDDREFVSGLEQFVSLLVEPGRINSLSQVLLKLTAPGVPDFYQGTELWDLSLVDPDNRRPVDFNLRRRLLHEVKNLSPEQILARMDEGLPKLWMIHKVLVLRKQLLEVFRSGDYRPLHGVGQKTDHVAAFLRGGTAATVTPRLILSLNGEWGDTWLELPEGRWRNHFTGDTFNDGKAMLRDILTRFPVAVLVKE